MLYIKNWDGRRSLRYVFFERVVIIRNMILLEDGSYVSERIVILMRTYQVKFHSIEDVKAFVNIANHYGYEIQLQRDAYQVDAKSILGVLSLGIGVPMTVRAHTLNASVLKGELTPYLI